MCVGFTPGGHDDLVEHTDQLIGGTRPECPGGQGFPCELVDNVEEPDLSAVDGDIDLEIQGPHLIRERRLQPLIPPRPDAAFLTHSTRSLQSLLTPESLGAFMVGDQTFAAAQRVCLPPAPPRMTPGDRAQPPPQRPFGLGDRRRPTLHRPRLPHHSAGAALRNPKPLLQNHHGPATAVRAQ